VHHAEQAHHRRARVEVQTALLLQSLHESKANAIVLTLDCRNLRAEAVLQYLVLMRKNLHAFLVVDEVVEMVFNEDSNTTFRIAARIEARLEFTQNRGEGFFLNQIQKPLFRTKIVV